MSMRKILVQYIGSTLCLPELEREVDEIAVRDKDLQIIQRFVPERTCYNNSFKDAVFVCSECGYQEEYFGDQNNYCPSCGAKVVE